MEKSRNVAAIDCAIDAIKQGSSIRKACAQFNVSKTTVLRHLKAVESNQPRPSMGPPPALPMTQIDRNSTIHCIGILHKIPFICG
jgi:transposase